jgi:hypothetical protein
LRREGCKRKFVAMLLSAFRRLGFAAWLVAIALIANLAAQNQLALNVVEATTERAVAPAVSADPHAHHRNHAQHTDHTATAPAPAPASHAHHAPGGHTHKGHADCALCGVVATMAALTLPSTVLFNLPAEPAQARPLSHVDIVRIAGRHTPYSSRAPPVLL